MERCRNPHPLEDHILEISLTLKGKLARTLLEYADGCDCEPVVLLADIVETVLKDNLIAAVLDR